MPERYFDPEGFTEPDTTPYTLTVYVPDRPPHPLLPKIFTRKAYHTPPPGNFVIQPNDTNRDLDCFEAEHLSSLARKTITLKSAWIPAELRCAHVSNRQRRADGKLGCDGGCYFLERGGDRVARWRCGTRLECEGHVYCGRVKRDEQGRACFGKAGARLVCLDDGMHQERRREFGEERLSKCSTLVEGEDVEV